MLSILYKGSPINLSLTCVSGQVTQVRNHSKIYPWRQNRQNRESYLDTTKTPYTDKYNINEFRPSKRERKEWMKVIPKDKDHRFNAYHWNDSYRSDPKDAKETSEFRLKRFSDSLKTRGAARESKAYTPPDGVRERILAICKGLEPNQEFDKGVKFDLITKCIAEFSHNMPSSYLTETKCINDLVEYFSTPVRGVNPYTSLIRESDQLPPNLSLIAEPHRFNKETDTLFNGVSALPGVISNVPGLRAAKKYPVLNQDEFQWPDI